MPPNNLRAFDDEVDGIENEGSDRNAKETSSERYEITNGESALKETNSDSTSEKETDDTSESTSLGDISSKDDGCNVVNRKPNSWIASAAAIAAFASVCTLEKCRQKKLTKVPLVMGQIPKGSNIESICNQLIQNDGILSQPIVPSLVLGTHGELASAAAFWNPGPKSSRRFSETLVSSYDGAHILLDWEIPQSDNHNTRKQAILEGSISHPTILILHGINNSSDYGYMKSLQTTMTNRGWNAVAMSFRGAGRGGRQPLTTPRSYTAAYTGDLRSIVHQLVSRMKRSNTTTTTNNNNNNNESSICPLFLLGNSLGGLLVTKYLGEEGLAGTLPENVLGGISLGNPFSFRSNLATLPFGLMVGAARKFNYLCQRKAMSMNHQTNSPTASVLKDPRIITLASLDKALAPSMVRTEPHPPFEPKIGYGHATDGVDSDQSNSLNVTPEESYWIDSSCYKQGRHVSVPLLHVIARDDSLCYTPSRHFLGYSLQNPNVVVVQTRTGGHLGWWHKPNINAKSASSWGLDSWADGATADFIQAVLDNRKAASPHSPRKIDDAYNLFAPKRTTKSRIDENHSASLAANASVRTLPGDRDSDSTIDTNDVSRRYYSRKRSRIKSIVKPSQTYFQFQQVLVLKNHIEEEQEIRLLERNRLNEKRDSIELSRLLRSRL